MSRKIIRSDSGTSRGCVFSNTRELQSDVIEAAANIIRNWRFTKPIAKTQIAKLVAWHARVYGLKVLIPTMSIIFFKRVISIRKGQVNVV